MAVASLSDVRDSSKTPTKGKRLDSKGPTLENKM